MDSSATSKSQNDSNREPWGLLQEGQLLIDVYERPDAIVVRSLAAGVKPEDLEISIQDDMLTIRGKREESEMISDNQFFYKECYWGNFSRTIILPVHVQGEKIKAFFKHGTLMIVLPKKTVTTSISLKTENDFLS